MARTRLYCNGILEAENFAVADISEHLERPDTVVWVDFCGPSKEELDELADELKLHELAVEDALGEHQRPKLDHYATHNFLACHAVELNTADGTLTVTEIDAFINQRWLVTVRKDGAFDLDQVIAREPGEVVPVPQLVGHVVPVGLARVHPERSGVVGGFRRSRLLGQRAVAALEQR